MYIHAECKKVEKFSKTKQTFGRVFFMEKWLGFMSKYWSERSKWIQCQGIGNSGNRERYDHDRHKVGRNFWPSIDPSLVNNLLLNKGGKKTARELFRGGNLVKFHLIWFNFTLSKNPSTLLLDLILVYPPLFLLEIRFSWFFKLVFNRNTERYVLTPRR